MAQLIKASDTHVVGCEFEPRPIKIYFTYRSYNNI